MSVGVPVLSRLPLSRSSTVDTGPHKLENRTWPFSNVELGKLNLPEVLDPGRIPRDWSDALPAALWRIDDLEVATLPPQSRRARPTLRRVP